MPRQSHTNKSRWTALLTTCLILAVTSSLGAVPLDISSGGSRASQGPSSTTLDQTFSRSQEIKYNYPGDTILVLEKKVVKKLSGGGSDCWGWRAPDGTRWAIMGGSDEVIFYDFENNQTKRVAAPSGGWCGSTIWRDMATYQNYCYSVSECEGENSGIMVMDMSFLPDSVHLVRVTPRYTEDSLLQYSRSHNLAIDTIMGMLYVESGYPEAVQVFSLADPADPFFQGGIDANSDIHDLHVVNDTAYLAGGNSGEFSVWTRTNPFFPFEKIAQINIPSGGYVHNTWTNHDRSILATTEETVGMTVKIWDISDITDIQLLGEYLGPSSLAHNVHIQGDRLYISHYNAGVRVVDISDPTNPTEIGLYNTMPNNTDNGFDGCWGIWPHDSDGWIYASNMDGLLFVLKDTTRVLTDSLWIETSPTIPSEIITVDLMLRNSTLTHSMTVPFSWSGGLDLTLVDIEVTGTLSEDFEYANLSTIDQVGNRGLITFVYDIADQTRGLDPGEGTLCRVNFTVPTIATTETATISFGNTHNPDVTLETTLEYTAIPDVASATLGYCSFPGPDSDGDGISDTCDICPGFDDFVDTDSDGIPDGCDECPTIAGPCPCCDVPGDADNSGSTTIGDVTFLITHIFSGGIAPECYREGDANGDGTLTIGDITFLIANIFTSGPASSCL